MVAVLCLKGISTNDFDSAIQAIYGEQAARLSAATVSRLKDVFTREYEQWRTERLSRSRSAYIWGDGVYFNARVAGERNCVLVVVRATFNGEKQLLAITNDVGESEASWKEHLLDLKTRGMNEDPKLAIADGALGFWRALPQVLPSTLVSTFTAFSPIEPMKLAIVVKCGRVSPLKTMNKTFSSHARAIRRLLTIPREKANSTIFNKVSG
jgi:transposase-like protein